MLTSLNGSKREERLKWKKCHNVFKISVSLMQGACPHCNMNTGRNLVLVQYLLASREDQYRGDNLINVINVVTCSNPAQRD